MPRATSRSSRTGGGSREGPGSKREESTETCPCPHTHVRTFATHSIIQETVSISNHCCGSVIFAASSYLSTGALDYDFAFVDASFDLLARLRTGGGNDKAASGI